MSSSTSQLWWVPDDSAVWTLATQSGAKQPNGCLNFSLHKDKSVVAFQVEQCIKIVGSLSAPEDLVFLHDVNQASILHCIRERFLEKKIYTSVGAVLMTVNPFERIPGIYGKAMIEKYRNPDEKKPLAHVFEIPSRAYDNMCRVGENQSILISGESGAGKTEATKQCLSYLTVVANSQAEESGASAKRPANALTVTEIANRIIAASPILEAFGNAKTIRNPNSSRFGKWMVLNFDKKNTIHSSNVVSYLLEKSRVTKRDSKERNYHIFYQVLRGCDRTILENWKMVPEARSYLYLQQDDGKEPVNLDDAAQYQETEDAFSKMGFSTAETMSILKVVCSILLLGNVQFNSTNDGEGSEVANPATVDAVSELLGVNPSILSYSLSNRSIESRKSMIAIVLNAQRAAESRDSLARQLYDKVFLSIVTQINLKSRINEGGEDFDRCIGLLDIFGFEIFVENSFEQVCINYCNEMLQNHFNFVVFTAEKNLYLQEGIVCETIEFRDNSEVIREIEGMFKSLDEEARIPKGSSKTWFDKLKRGAKLANVSFPNRRVGQVFVVKHYAGDVDYNPLGLLEKNTETLSNDLVGAMLSSTESIIQAMFDPNPVAPADAATVAGRRRLSLTNPGAELQVAAKPAAAPPGRKGGAGSSALAQKSISWNFTNQLTALMNMLRKTESHFIRCVKSNDKCAPSVFDSKLVHKQLLYSGVFEVVKIQQSGLPCRLSHNEFLARYKCLSPSRMRYTLKTSKELLTWLTSAKYDLPMAQMGRTKTFFKSHEQRILETARNELFRTSAIKIQRLARKIACSFYFKHLRAHYRDFMHSYTELQLEPATVSYHSFNAFLATFQHIRRYAILKHVAERLTYNLSILAKRVELVEDAKQRLLVRTEESVLSLQDIITASIDLDLTQHSVVIHCKNTVKMYFRALEFVDLISVPIRLRTLGMAHINEGIESLVSFQDLLPGSIAAIDAAQTHKRLVDQEIKNIVIPLRAALANAAVVYDSSTGNLKQKLRGDDHMTTLRNAVHALSEQSMNFNCTDSQHMYNDCYNFLTFLDEYVPLCDAVGATSFMNSHECAHSTNALFNQQLDEFRMWADMQMSTVKLKEAMCVGKVSLSALGNEPPVVLEEIQAVLDKLSVLRDPSQNLRSAIRAGTWILKLRRAYMEADWLSLEQLVIDADTDGVENCVFDDFAECIDELNNCQWQVIYNGLSSDAVAVLSEPCFTAISLAAENWVELVKDLPDNMTLVETIQDFAVEDLCPRLYRLIPLLENTLQLRSLMYQKDMELSKVLHNSFWDTHAEVIEDHGLSVPMKAELKRCGELIRKNELEEELDHLLATITTSVYAYEGVNEMPTYNSLYNQTYSIEDLEAVLRDFDALGETFHSSLQEKIDISTTLLKGRKRMAQAEDTPGIIWNDCLTDFEEGMTACLRGSTILPEYIRAEYEIIVGELIRRSLLQGYMTILKTICIQGEVDINISVDEKVLIPLFHQYNHLSQLMSENYEEYPNNLKALTKFTSAVLKLRKHVVDGQWDRSIEVLLEQLQSMEHGGGRDIVPGIKEEIEKVRAELLARQAIQKLKYALENIPVTIPENPEDTTNMVDLGPLRTAAGGIMTNNGKHSKQMKALADSVVTILEALVSGQFAKINPAQVDEAAAQYVSYHLNSTAIEKIFRYTRVHNFLKNLCDAMREHTSPEQLFTSINTVRNSLLSVPERFIPWLKAAYIYCESVSANATEDWIKMVEATRKLEECIQTLSGVKIVAESEALNENIFLELMHEKAASGYSAALRIKSQEQKQRAVEEIQGMSNDELSKLKIKQEDEGNPYGITQLRLAGYDDSSILNVKFPVKFLWALDFDPVLLRKKGFKAGKLLAAGYSVAALYQAGFNVLKLKAAGCSVDVLREAGVSFEQLRIAGFDDADILKGQLPDDFLRSVEYDAGKLLRMGLALKDLVAAGLSALELRAAGFTVMELKQAGITSIQELRKAGFDLNKLKSGFDIYELHDAGFSFAELQASGVDDKSLLDAGFGAELEQQALRELYIATNGPLWKVRLNWCTSKPLSQWYGVRVEKDLQRNERVVGLDLSDNHLIGTIPEKLWLLSKLRSLHLGLNFLSGPVPAQLVSLIRTNNIHTDLNCSSNGEGSAQTGDSTAFPHSPNQQQQGHHHQMDTSSSGARRLDFEGTPFAATSLGLGTPSKANYVGAGNNNNANNVSTMYMSGPASFGMGPSYNVTTELENDLDSIERAALMDLFHATNGPRWHNKLHWGSTRPVGEWKGVTVNKSGAVVKLVLPSNNLQGSIPTSIYYLEALRELDLRLNQVCGPIPETLGHMRQLTHVHLQSNRLSGSIPESLGDLTLVQLLDLRCNQLSDYVPKSFMQLRRMKYLGLKSNLLKSRPIELQQMLPWCKIVT